MGSDTEGSNTLASRTLGSSSPEPVTIGIDTMLLSVADNNCLFNRWFFNIDYDFLNSLTTCTLLPSGMTIAYRLRSFVILCLTYSNNCGPSLPKNEGTKFFFDTLKHMSRYHAAIASRSAGRL